jgi:hypothetical protein
MPITSLYENKVSINLSGLIHRKRVIPLHRFMREHFNVDDFEIYSERNFLDDNENHIEIEIHKNERNGSAVRLFKMVWM